MRGQLWYSVVVIAQLCSLVASSYFHVKSYTIYEDDDNNTNFGFSMTLQDKVPPTLVVGAPRGSRVGNVHTCPLQQTPHRSKCDKLGLDIDKYDYYRGKNQSFWLGATVIARPDYFLACAPLWSAEDKVKDVKAGSYGTCFVYNNSGIEKQMKDLLWQKKKTHFQIDNKSVYGGTGWSSILDPSNELILIGKPAANGDIQYVKSNTPLKTTKSLYFDGKTYVSEYDAFFKKNSDNIGYAFATGFFFTDEKKSFIAFSLLDKTRIGKVSFFKYDNEKKEKLILQDLKVSDNVVGSQFGATLHGAMLDPADGATALLVGAPAHASHGQYDAGAVYIYLGGKFSEWKRNIKYRVIQNDVPGGRFGSTIASSDVDGDYLPEIFVSAPYENSENSGTLYILSGFEIRRNLTKSKKQIISVSELKLTQKISQELFKWFGYSLQVLPTSGQKYCNDLAVGAPRSAKIMLLNCVDAVNATITAELKNTLVKENDTSFDVKVCVTLSYNGKDIKNITTQLWIENKVTGYGAKLPKRSYDVDLNKLCQIVTVELTEKYIGTYKFYSKLKTDIDTLMRKKEFDPNWVTLSPYGTTDAEIPITRHCVDDCTIRLNLLPILWNGRQLTEHKVNNINKASVTISVSNKGSAVYDACVVVHIEGAQTLSTECGNYDNGDAAANSYQCWLSKPLDRSKIDTLNIDLDLTTTEDRVRVKAVLYNNCNNNDVNETQESKIEVRMIYSIEDIKVISNNHMFDIRETPLINSQLNISDSHMYTIINNGSINWINVVANVNIPKNFINNVAILISEEDAYCEANNSSISDIISNCYFNLDKFSNISIIINTELEKSKMVKDLKKGNKLDIASKISVVFRNNSGLQVSESQTTTYVFKTDLGFKNNMDLIIALAVVGALIILAIFIVILYKMGFFKRKQKESLELAREESIRRSNKSNKSNQQSPAANDNKPDSDEFNLDEIEIDVVDECFEPIENPENVPDNIALVEPETTSKERNKQGISNDG